MKFTAAAAVAAFAAVVQAGYPAANVTYTTEVVTAFTTYCPAATTISHNGYTYTITEATTLTITNCPCTISKPVYTSSYVSCSTCAPVYPTSSESPVYPTSSAVPTVYPNSTYVAPTTSVYPTGGVTTSSYPTSVPTAGAAKAVAFSGAGLAGVLGLVAYVL